MNTASFHNNDDKCGMDCTGKSRFQARFACVKLMGI